MNKIHITNLILTELLSLQWDAFYPSSITITVFIITSVAVLYFLFPKVRFLKKYKSEYIAQSEAIKLERQRISEELHDELGSGLSAVKLYAELAAKNNAEITELGELNDMINDISVKINDIIWTTSTENDQFDNVIFYIQDQLAKLFRHSAINFESILPEEIPFLRIKSESRRDIYLLAKEIAHNTLKHSQAEKVILEIIISPEVITLMIKDDGKGFDPVAKEKAGMGLSSINNRVKRLNSSLTIENYKCTKVLINIPILDNFYPEIEVPKSTYIFSFWNKN